MKSNRPKLNSDKAQFLWFGSKQQLAKIYTKTMTIGEHSMESSTSAKNLGVTFDSELGMDLHVNNITRSCFYQLRQPRSIRRSLFTDAAETFVNSLISSRVDYCNSIFYGDTNVVVRRLQSIINAAARLISNQMKFRPHHSCAEQPEGSVSLASHQSVYRLQDCGLRLQRPPRSRSNIPQMHLQSCPKGRHDDSPAICSSR